MTWRPIIGRSFSAPEFREYVEGLQFDAWRPRFIVVHNTSAPDTKTWQGWQTRKPPISDEKWMQNLVGYYRDEEDWSSGPHLFVTPGAINVFTPLTGPGTHSPSWNSISWGIETVGEFERDPFTGPVRDNLIAACAILHAAAGLQPRPYQVGVRGLHFHKEDPKTTHRSCPGRNMVKADVVAAVEAKIIQMHDGDHVPSPPPPHADRTGTVNTPDLNVRSSAGAAFDVVAALAKGTPLAIVGEAMNGPTKWLQIRTGKTAGWVAARFVDLA
jgi:hypothetical protein